MQNITPSRLEVFVVLVYFFSALETKENAHKQKISAGANKAAVGIKMGEERDKDAHFIKIRQRELSVLDNTIRHKSIVFR